MRLTGPKPGNDEGEEDLADHLIKNDPEFRTRIADAFVEYTM